MENSKSSIILTGSVFWQFTIFVLLIGGAPIAIKIVFSELGPFFLGFIRHGIAALFFWALVLIKGMEIPRGRKLLGAVLYGIFGFGLSFLCLAWGLTETSASLGSVLMATLPLLTIILSSVQGTESLNSRGIFGAFLAVAGTSLSVGGTSSTEISLLHVAAIILGTAFIGESNVIFKKFPRSNPIITNAIAMTSAGIILGIVSIIFGETWLLPTKLATWIALGYHVVPVTILAFFLYAQVLSKWTATATSYSFVLTPLVTVFIAAIFYAERISITFVIGSCMVLAGVVVGALLPGKKPAMQEEMLEDCKPC